MLGVLKGHCLCFVVGKNKVARELLTKMLSVARVRVTMITACLNCLRTGGPNKVYKKQNLFLIDLPPCGSIFSYSAL